MAKLAWLEEVKADAERITLKRIRDNQAEKEYEESKTEVKPEAETESQDESVEEPATYQEKTDKAGRTYYVGPGNKRVSKEEYETNKEG